MDFLQEAKVKEVIEAVKAIPDNHELTGWVKDKYVYMFLKVSPAEREAQDVRLFAIDRGGNLFGYDGSGMKWVNGDKSFHTSVDWLTGENRPTNSKHVRALLSQLR
jgi:hypothetical protein